MIESVVSQRIPSEKLKEELYKKVSVKTGAAVEDIEKVISFQFADVRAATNEFAVIELSKLCKFVINQAKLKRMEKIYAEKVEKLKTLLATCGESRRIRVEMDLRLFTENLAYLRTKFRDELPKTKHKENNEKRKQALLQAREEVTTELDEVFNQ